MATSNVQINTPTQVIQRAADSYQDGPFTYSAAITALTPAAAATDVFTLENPSASLFIIRIVAVGMSGTSATTTITPDISLVKRSTLNTGGTSTSPASVPHDSTNPAAVAIARAYTANPVLGTTVGVKRSVKFPLLGLGAALSAPTYLLFDADGKTMQPYVLRPGQLVSVNMNGVTLSTPSIDVFMEWTESLY